MLRHSISHWLPYPVPSWVPNIIVVTQCLLLPTGTHRSYTTHTVSIRGGGGGEREILAAVTQCDLSRSHVSWRGGGGGGARVATPNDCEAQIHC